MECQIFSYIVLLRKTEVLKTSIFEVTKFVSSLLFGELQLKHISLNFKASCRNLKIKCVGAKAFVVFPSS